MKSNTIQSLIKKHLLMFRVVVVDGAQIKVGKSYDQVLKDVLAEAKANPLIDEKKVKTSKNCVTWYASKMRSQKEKHFDKAILEIKDRLDWSTLPEEPKPGKQVSAKAQAVAAKA